MAERIKICHVITRMDRGGAPDIVRILFEKLDPQHFDLTLVYGATLYPSQKARELIAALGEKAIAVPSLHRDVKPFCDLKAFITILKILIKGKFDIVHTHTAKAGVLGRLGAKFAGVRTVIHSPHGHDFYGYFGPLASRLVVLAERFAALFCDRIHCLTELEKKDMISFKVCPAAKCEVIYSGVEIDALRPSQSVLDRIRGVSAACQKQFCVGVIGRLEPIKGVRYFIDAAQIVAKKISSIKFFVVGDGALRSELEKYAADKGLADRFVFTGWTEEVSTILLSLDILVLPSLNEAVGRSVLEAQAAGVPVVGTKVGGVPEVVLDGVTGILVAPKDALALGEAIVSLLNDTDKRKRMSEAARGWVDEKFSDRVMIKSFEEMYLRLVSR